MVLVNQTPEDPLCEARRRDLIRKMHTSYFSAQPKIRSRREFRNRAPPDERGSTIAVSHREFENLLKISVICPIGNAASPLVQGIYFEGSTLHLLSSILHVSQEHFSLPSLPGEASPDQFFREVFLCAHFVYFTFIFSFLMSCLCFVCGCKVGQG